MLEDDLRRLAVQYGRRRGWDANSKTAGSYHLLAATIVSQFVGHSVISHPYLKRQLCI